MARQSEETGSTAHPLILDSAWRVDSGKPEVRSGDNVHPLRLVPPLRTGPAETVEQGVDREEIRAIVAEVLREELRGELGRRMTGSIRKLVRQEISRVFSAFRPR